MPNPTDLDSLQASLAMLSMTYYDDPGGEVPTVHEVLAQVKAIIAREYKRGWADREEELMSGMVKYEDTKLTNKGA